MARGIKVEKIRRGRRANGGVYTVPSGGQCYIAYRTLADVHRFGSKTISSARRDGIAAFGIDEETLITLRARNILFAGVQVKETRDIFLARLEEFFDSAKAKTTFMRGCIFRFLPLQCFHRKPGKVRV